MPRLQRGPAFRTRSGSTSGAALGRRAFAGAFVALLVVVIGGVALLRSWRTSPAKSAPREYATGTGQRAAIVLADGSRVTLAPQSRLRVGADFGARTRTVSLVGEAIFDVTTATRTPFIVSTDGVDTRVLGTTFDVRRYPDDPAVRVAVVHGKVAVRSSHRPPRLAPLILTSGTVGLVTDTTAVATAVGDNDEYTSWTRGELRFRETPVRSMLDAVGRWYGYHFLLSDSTLAERHVTAQFILNEPAKTLAALKELLDVDMTFDGNRVLLRPRSNSSARSANKWKDRTPTLQRQEVGK
jgi:ferric-dicitrate binding protein FerR (iron transport regulator)